MAHIKGPAIFLAQFMRDEEPYNTIDNIGRWVAGLGYKGVQIPAWDGRAIDLNRAAESKTYCDEYRGRLQEMGLEPTELAAYLAGQVLAMHPAYEILFQGFHPPGLKGGERTAWAAGEIEKTIRASIHFGTEVVPVLSGGLAWHMVYPWPQRPEGIIDAAFEELARLWQPLLDLALDNGKVIAFELHPGSDIFDGATFEMFLDHTDDHEAACLNYDPSHFLMQQLDYLQFIQLYGERIKGFHVKDAEFRPSGRVGVYGGYQPWKERAARFRSLGDGQVDFSRIFTLLTEAGYDGWAVLEWECCIKSPEQGAAEGAPFIARHIIETTEVAFDDFAGSKADVEEKPPYSRSQLKQNYRRKYQLNLGNVNYAWAWSAAAKAPLSAGSTEWWPPSICRSNSWPAASLRIRRTPVRPARSCISTLLVVTLPTPRWPQPKPLSRKTGASTLSLL